MAMPVVKASPQKRKHTEEYHDPDYPNHKHLQQNSQHDINATDTGPPYMKRKKENEMSCDTDGILVSDDKQCLQKVYAVIEREFQREIHLKQQQLQEIDNRLTYAKHLFERLRYSIVAAYYRKQDLPLAANDAATIRGTRTLFEREDKGPQTQIHPAIKNSISKKPRGTRPQRSAAQLAKETIRAKIDVDKKEEKKRQKLIRRCGIVIDHTEQDAQNNRTTLRTATTRGSTGVESAPTQTKKKISSPSKVKALNTTRLNNKLRHLIVVGNTSKYIGDKLENDKNNKSQGHHKFTHKWLVYVQSKDAENPLERYVKKVRFYLHSSYRPNDIIDVHAPPYHISRRGWGEFPIRVQLFFHSEYHQKPIQLVHNIILDKTLTGIQTLGAETILEIYLRDVERNYQENSTDSSIEGNELDMTKKCEQAITMKTEELLDDDTNLLEFLNKIEATPVNADLEKINPTIGVIESLTNKLKTTSPIKDLLMIDSKIRMSPTKQSFSKTPENTLPAINCPLENVLEKELSIATTIEVSSPTVHPIFATAPASSASLLPKSSTATTAMATATATNTLLKHIENTIETSTVTTVGLSLSQSPEKEKNKNPAAVVKPFEATFITKSPEKSTAPIAVTTTIDNSEKALMKSIAISSNTTTTTTTIAAFMQQSISSPINQKPNAVAAARSPILIINKNNRIVMPAATVASPVRRVILPLTNKNANIITNNSLAMGNVVINGISSSSKPNCLNASTQNTTTTTATTSTRNDLMLQSVAVVNDKGGTNSKLLPLKQFQKRIVKVVDSEGHVKYIPMLVNTNSTNNCTTTPIPATTVAGITVKTAVTSTITTTVAATSVTTGPRIVSITPATTLRNINIVNNKVNKVINAKNCTPIAGGTNPLRITVKPKIVQIKSDVLPLQQTKPKIFTISTMAMGTMPTTIITTVSATSATIPKNIISVQIKPNQQNVYNNQQQQRQQRQQQQQIKLLPIGHNNKRNAAVVTTMATTEKQPSINVEPISPASSNVMTAAVTATTTTTKTTTTTASTDKFNSMLHTIGTNVLYKEGTLCIIDPIQMKLKQQQKKQISLLKPQVSLLKQKQQQKTKQQKTIKSGTKSLATNTNAAGKCKQFVDDSMKAKSNGRELERIQVERKYFKQHFRNVQTAVEYLLKNTPIYCTSDENSNNTISTLSWWLKFQSLPSIKQRSLEWLRAKYITKLLHKHKQLKELTEKTKNNQLWTTREVVLFGRQYHFTPPIKVKGGVLQPQTMDFATLIKRELKQQQQKQQQQQCRELFTLNESIKLRKWLRKMWQQLSESKYNYNHVINGDYDYDDDDDDDVEIVDIINVPLTAATTAATAPTRTTPKTQTQATSSNSLMLYNQRSNNQWNKCNGMMILKPPAQLENECVIVQDICKNTLQYHIELEELQIGILYPATLTILAHCLHRFLEKLLRQTLAMKYQCTNRSREVNASADNVVQIFNHDIRQMLCCSTNIKEFDFLTNQHFAIKTFASPSSATAGKSLEDEKLQVTAPEQSKTEK